MQPGRKQPRKKDTAASAQIWVTDASEPPPASPGSAHTAHPSASAAACQNGAAGYRQGLGSGVKGCWDGAVMDLAPLPTGMRREDGGEGKRSWCRSACGTLSPAEGIHWGTGPAASSQPTCLSSGSSLRQVMWKPLGQDAGCPGRLWSFISLGGCSPLQRKSCRLLSERFPSVGWDCNQCWWGRNASVLPSSVLWRLERKETQGNKSGVSPSPQLMA